MRKKLLACTVINFIGIIVFSCGTPDNTLTIKNWPYNGRGRITIYIDEEIPPSQTNNKESKDISELTREKFYDFIVDALQSGHQSKRVAICTSLSLSSPFKLVSSEGTGDWTGNGVYTVKIFIPNTSVGFIEKTNVVFSNGSAIIDYNNMTMYEN